MSATDELLRNNEHYAGSFTKGGLPLPPANIPHRGDVRGFGYDVRTGRLHEVK